MGSRPASSTRNVVGSAPSYTGHQAEASIFLPFSWMFILLHKHFSISYHLACTTVHVLHNNVFSPSVISNLYLETIYFLPLHMGFYIPLVHVINTFHTFYLKGQNLLSTRNYTYWIVLNTELNPFSIKVQKEHKKRLCMLPFILPGADYFGFGICLEHNNLIIHVKNMLVIKEKQNGYWIRIEPNRPYTFITNVIKGFYVNMVLLCLQLLFILFISFREPTLYQYLQPQSQQRTLLLRWSPWALTGIQQGRLSCRLEMMSMQLQTSFLKHNHTDMRGAFLSKIQKQGAACSTEG